MRKSIYIFLFALLSLIFLLSVGCKRQTSFLLDYVSELKSDIFTCDSEYNLTATYGYKETPYSNDAKVGDKEYALTFILKDQVESQVEYFLIIPEFNDCKLVFSKSKSGNLVATLEKEDFSSKTLDVKLCFGENIVDITLNSIIPKDTLDINKVLLKLQVEQENLVTHYVDGLNFNAEIYARILVKNDKVYWYIAFGDGDNLKALLVDGITGEVLAIREVI